MKVLIACEESQTECKAFRALGYEAYSCDILEPSGKHPEWHIHGDALEALKGDVITTMDGVVHEIGSWDLLIAHPPCTYLSNVGSRWLYKDGELNYERIELAHKARAFFMEFLTSDIPHICVENPIPSKIHDLPRYDQKVHPYQFYGKLHPYTKATCYWLKNLPMLTPVDSVAPIGGWLYNSQGFSYADIEASRRGVPRSQMRSKSFEGVARAMAEQWGSYLNG